MVDPVAETIAPIVQQVTPVATPVTQPLADVTTPAAQPLAETLAPIVEPLTEVATPVVQPLAGVVDPLVVSVVDAIDTTVPPLTDSLSPIAAPVFDTVDPVLAPVTDVSDPTAAPLAGSHEPDGAPAIESSTPSTDMTALLPWANRSRIPAHSTISSQGNLWPSVDGNAPPYQPTPRRRLSTRLQRTEKRPRRPRALSPVCSRGCEIFPSWRPIVGFRSPDSGGAWAALLIASCASLPFSH